CAEPVPAPRRLDPQSCRDGEGLCGAGREVLTQVTEARAKASQIKVDASTVTDPAKFKEFQDAQNALTGALGRLLVTVERYPDLKSNQNFLALQSQLEGTENRISVARRDYIDSVRAYNTELKTFPGLIWGGSFGGAGASGSFLFGRTDGLDNATAPRGAGDVIISDVDKRRVAGAIRAAEEKTAGEIFCVIAHACGNYRLVPIAWAALVALAVPLPLIYLTARPAGIIYLLQLAAFIVAALVLSLPMIRFRIVPKRRMWGRVHAEAMHQFLAQGIHLTEHRTGVL